MSTKTVVIFLLLLYFDSIICKGLYSGVPCHRVYYCIVGEINDVPEDSVLIGQEQNIEDEKTCQDLCFKMENCVTYSWWNEKEKVGCGEWWENYITKERCQEEKN